MKMLNTSHERGWQSLRKSLSLFAILAQGIAVPGAAFAQTAAQTQPPPPNLPLPGITPLPQDSPPTGLQATLPAPALPIAPPDKPLKSSPGLNALIEKMRTQPLTINDAVALALGVNRSLALSGEALLRAQGRTQETRAGFNPTLGSTLSYTRLNQSNSIFLNGQTVPLVNDSQRAVGVQATLPIDIAGLLRAANDQARFQEVAQRLDINRTRNQIVGDVKTAFYDVLRTQVLVRVATENLQNSLDRYNDAVKKLQAGTVARFDVIRASTDVANAQQQLIQARTNVSLNIAALNNAIGIDIDTPLQITDTGAVENPPGVAPPAVPPMTENPTPPGPNAKPNGENTTENASVSFVAPQNTPGAQEPVNPQNAPPLAVSFDPLNLGAAYDQILKEALQTRPELLQADANISAARKGILIANRSQLPTLGLTWGLNYAPDTAGFAPNDTTWQAVATISLPLFDGGVARARVRQARADVSTAETNRRQAADLIVLDVRQNYLNLVQARNSVAVANQALEQAREAFRLARVRYNAGVSAQAGISPLLEVSDAQNALTQAESNQVNALYNYNNARSRLDRAIGRYSFVNNGPGYSAPPTPKTTGMPGSGGKK